MTTQHEQSFVMRAFQAMGCRFEFMIAARGSQHDRYSVEAIADEMVDLVHDWHQRLTVFEPESIVSRINRQSAAVPTRIDQDFYELLRLCEAMRTETSGAFNIASGTLMHAHGFRGEPTRDTLENLDLAHAISLDDTQMSVCRNDERVSLDFGAIAKGFVLDLIAKELNAYGIQHAFCHGGTSSAIAMGENAPGIPWRVRISGSPSLDAELHTVMGMGISDARGRVRTGSDGSPQGHIMNPSDACPVSGTMSRVACIHPSAAIADAYSTALHVRPELIDALHEHGCSIAQIPEQPINPAQSPPLIRDRLSIFKSSTS